MRENKNLKISLTPQVCQDSEEIGVQIEERVIKITDNDSLKVWPTPQLWQGSEGIGVTTATLGEVPLVENTPSSNLLFLEWTKQVSREHPDTLEYMLKSSDQLDRVIAKRIVQNASEGC